MDNLFIFINKSYSMDIQSEKLNHKKITDTTDDSIIMQ
jgi:hypothetical protein